MKETIAEILAEERMEVLGDPSWTRMAIQRLGNEIAGWKAWCEAADGELAQLRDELEQTRHNRDEALREVERLRVAEVKAKACSTCHGTGQEVYGSGREQGMCSACEGATVDQLKTRAEAAEAKLAKAMAVVEVARRLNERLGHPMLRKVIAAFDADPPELCMHLPNIEGGPA